MGDQVYNIVILLKITDMESVAKDTQPSVISEPLPSTSSTYVNTPMESVAAQTNRESENFDRYAYDWDMSSSDEFDSEFDIDKEGKVNAPLFIHWERCLLKSLEESFEKERKC